VAKIYDGTDAATLASGNYTLAGVVPGDSVALNDPANGAYRRQGGGNGQAGHVSGLALSGADVANYVWPRRRRREAVGVIATPPIDNGILANLTGRPIAGTPLASATAVAPAIMSAADSGGQNVSMPHPQPRTTIGEDLPPLTRCQQCGPIAEWCSGFRAVVDERLILAAGAVRPRRQGHRAARVPSVDPDLFELGERGLLAMRDRGLRLSDSRH